MSIRQDSDPFCMLWLGIVILSSFIFNFIYLGFLMPESVLVIGSAFALLSGISLLMIFLLVGYLRPARGKGKSLMMALSIVVGFFFVIFVDEFVNALPAVGTTLYLSAWGLGGSVLTAGGLSVMHTREESHSPGMLDVRSLHYGGAPKPAEEAAPKTETKPEKPADAIDPTSTGPNE